jgi:hypothetical protein
VTFRTGCAPQYNDGTCKRRLSFWRLKVTFTIGGMRSRWWLRKTGLFTVFA